MPTSWAQKRAQIAQTMQGSVVPGGLGMGNAGATFRTNPLIGQGGTASASGGLMGQAGGGGQMARMAQMPGFNYVPPPTGPAPVPQQVGAAGQQRAPSMQELGSAMFFGGSGTNLDPEASRRLYNFNNRRPPGGHR